MPAADIATLYQFEHYIDEGCKTVIDAQITDEEIVSFVQASSESLSTPRIEIQFSLGNDRKQMVKKDGSYWPNAFNGTLRFVVVTNRTNDSESQLHKKYRAVILWLMNDYNRQFTTENLPYHEIVDCTLTSATPTVQDEDDQDISTLTFSVVAGIRSSAWPE